MEMNKDFCIFILTHGRPNKVLTYKTLIKAGCTYPIYLIIDNKDKHAEKYYEKFGRDKVIMFDKLAASETFDVGDNFPGRKGVVYARNASFKIAKELGFTYFLALDDDYNCFCYQFDNSSQFVFNIIRRNIDKLFESTLKYYKSINALTISYSQGGDYMGGSAGQSGQSIRIKRKAMNTFFCSIERPFNFFGRINEDVNMYIEYGRRGELVFQINNLAIRQLTTQQNKGGLTEQYKEIGTYVKSFYTVMYAPSCTKISLMGSTSPRLHHKIKWNNAVPKIISEDLKKK